METATPDTKAVKTSLEAEDISDCFRQRNDPQLPPTCKFSAFSCNGSVCNLRNHDQNLMVCSRDETRSKKTTQIESVAEVEPADRARQQREQFTRARC